MLYLEARAKRKESGEPFQWTLPEFKDWHRIPTLEGFRCKVECDIYLMGSYRGLYDYRVVETKE